MNHENTVIEAVADSPQLSEAKRRFIELDKKKAEYKQFIEDYKAATEVLTAEIGINSYFQDDEGVVYKTTIPGGKFVYFDKYEVCRTRRGEESKGSLSLTEARAAGFIVEGK